MRKNIWASDSGIKNRIRISEWRKKKKINRGTVGENYLTSPQLRCKIIHKRYNLSYVLRIHLNKALFLMPGNNTIRNMNSSTHSHFNRLVQHTVQHHRMSQIRKRRFLKTSNPEPNAPKIRKSAERLSKYITFCSIRSTDLGLTSNKS